MIRTRTPLRISFFGGGTDLPEFSRKYGGTVVTTAINKYLYVAIRKRADSRITLDSAFGHERCETPDKIQHPLVRAVLKHRQWQGGVFIWLTADMPHQGCGLGTSSALIVGLLKAVDPSKRQWEIAQQAAAIQLELGNQGVQDAYICALGGFRYFKFHKDGSVDVRDLPPLTFGDKLLLFNTNQFRDSQEAQKAEKSDEVLLQIKQLAQDFVQIEPHSRVFPSFLKKTWELKRKVSAATTNTQINKIYQTALDAGAESGKLLGAGNGGHFLFYVEPKSQATVRCRLTDMGLTEVPFGFDQKGVTVLCSSKG